MSDLPAGRELDALVAEKVMGLEIEKIANGHMWFRDGVTLRSPIPHYSTDIAAAWHVVEHLNAQSITVEITALVSRANRSVRHIVYTYNNETCMPRDQAIESSAPYAICVVALKALANQRHESIDTAARGSH
jgi:hypothetical protein